MVFLSYLLHKFWIEIVTSESNTCKLSAFFHGIIQQTYPPRKGVMMETIRDSAFGKLVAVALCRPDGLV